MTTNRTNPTPTGDQGFAQRRLSDIAGLAAIASIAFVASLLTGVHSPLFAVVLLGALGALVYGEQHLRRHDARTSAHAHRVAVARWQH